MLALQVWLLLGWTPALTTPSPAGFALAVGLLCFWSLRLILQVGNYSPQHWVGKPFESAIHFLLVLGLLYMNGVYLSLMIHQRRRLQPAG